MLLLIPTSPEPPAARAGNAAPSRTDIFKEHRFPVYRPISAANCDPDMPKMRSSLFPLLLPLLLGADYVLSQTQSMPAIVAALPDARALWTHLEDESFLPARFKTKELKYFYDEPWQAFLQAQGSKFIDKQ